MTGMLAALAAEVQRTRRSAASRLAAVGLLICLLSLAGQALVSTTRSWASLMAWHGVYVTGFAAVLPALLVALVERRERRARGAGTAWRATPPTAQRAARLAMTVALALLADLLVFLPYVPAGLALGLGDPPLGRLLTAAVVTWAGGLGWLVTATALARVCGPWPVVGVGVAWQVVGTVLAESDRWWLLPPTWGVRPLLPIVGTHANGTPLEAGSPVGSYLATPSVALSAALALLALPGAVLGPRAPRLPSRAAAPAEGRRGKRRERPGQAVVARPADRPAVVPRGADEPAAGARRPPRPVLALVGSLRRTGLAWLVALAATVLVCVAAVYPAPVVLGVFGLLVLPAGSATLAVLSWQAQEGAWRVVLTRAVRAGASAVRLLLLLDAVVTGASLGVGGLLVVAGDPPGHALARVAVAVAVGCAVVSVTLWSYARWHVAAALVGMLLGLLGGFLFGGSALAATPLWLLGPTAWVVSAGSSSRTALALVLGLGAALAAGAAFVRAVSRDSPRSSA